MMNSSPLVAIVGPTAVGKSSLALPLASAFSGEIVSADSRQVYRYMDIGTSKPTEAQRAEVRHHLVDCIDPDEEFSLATFLQMAQAAVDDTRERDLLPIVVGGTGQYIWAFLEGWQAPRVEADEGLRRELEQVAASQGPETLHNALQKVDPESAGKIDRRNVRRVVRALEVYYTTGKPATELRRKVLGLHEYRVLGLDMPREELYRRIDRRVDEMVAMGLVGEVENLLAFGYSAGLPSMSGIGYREVVEYLQGTLSLEEAVLQIKYNTHRLARRQYAWFRQSDPRITWLTVGEELESQASAIIQDLLLQDRAAMIE